MNKDIVSETQVVVLMGGLGTRLGLKDCPKAMADINGHPFFDYQLRLLKRWEFRKFLFLVGYCSDSIEAYYGDGTKWGIDIQYSYDGPVQMGTGGALKKAQDRLEEDFLLIYGDSFMDIDYRETVYRYHIGKQDDMSGIMAILENGNRYDKSNVIFKNGKIMLYDKNNTSDEMEYIDYGVMMLSQAVIADIKKETRFDLSELLTGLSREGKLAAQVVSKRFYEIGCQASMQEFSQYAKKRFDKANKAVFFDRDGVINELFYNDDIGQFDSPLKKEHFVYRKGMMDELLFLQERGYYLFIVTNQPAAAKGKVSLDGLYGLNTWMVQDLERKGVSVEFANLCPHHPAGSSKSKAQFLIKDCGCRKPKEGLIIELLQVYNIDIGNSYMVGDSYTDVIAGKKAGLKTILVGGLKCDACQRLQGKYPDYIIENVAGLGRLITGKE